MVSFGIRNSVSSSRVRSSGRETTTRAPLATLSGRVATTNAVPFPLPAIFPDASIVAIDVGLMDH